MASPRSGPPSSTKEYVWERRSKSEGVWEVVNHIEEITEELLKWDFLLFLFRQAFDNPSIIMQHSQLFHEWCLPPRAHIPQLFTSDLHKYIIIGSPDLIDKPLGCNPLNGGLQPMLAPPR